MLITLIIHNTNNNGAVDACWVINKVIRVYFTSLNTWSCVSFNVHIRQQTITYMYKVNLQTKIGIVIVKC